MDDNSKLYSQLGEHLTKIQQKLIDQDDMLKKGKITKGHEIKFALEEKSPEVFEKNLKMLHRVIFDQTQELKEVLSTLTPTDRTDEVLEGLKGLKSEPLSIPSNLPVVAAVKELKAELVELKTLSSLIQQLTTTLTEKKEEKTEGECSKILDSKSEKEYYIGEAAPGSNIKDAVWRIKRGITLKGITYIEWAGGSPEFNQVWDQREKLKYSL